MKTLFITALCVLALNACTKEKIKNSGDISKNVIFYDPGTILDYIKSNKITPEQALNSIEDLQKAFKDSYIGYEIKKNLINKSGDEIFAECKLNLKQNSEGLSSFELYDHVLQCLAGFKDSHISLTKMIAPSFVSSGISETIMIENKLYISRIRPKLITKIEELQKLPAGGLTDIIKIGTEVVLIDGEPPQAQIDKIKKYVSASSEAFLQNTAVSKLFTRRFFYPTKESVTLTLKSDNSAIFEVSLPWVQVINSSNQGSLESRTLLSERGIIKSTDLDADKKIISSSGVDLSLPLFKNIANRRTYQDDVENDALVTGFVNVQNKNYCYLQLNTFSFDPDPEFGFKITERIADKTYPLSLPLVLQNYLQTCEAFKAPLIFDLRNNGGGNTRVADLIYTLFETSNTKNTYSARANLATIGNFSVMSNSLNAIDSIHPSLDNILTFRSLKESLNKKQSVTDWLLIKKQNPLQNIFTGEIVLLTSDNCISACELTANRFKKSDRAKIIGTATNGTGFGFSSNNTGKTNFRDSLNFFEVAVPNFAFQSVLVENDSAFDVINDAKGTLLEFSKMSVLENNPVTPDFEIKYTLKDLSGDYVDYIESLSKILSRNP